MQKYFSGITRPVEFSRKLYLQTIRRFVSGGCIKIFSFLSYETPVPKIHMFYADNCLTKSSFGIEFQRNRKVSRIFHINCSFKIVEKRIPFSRKTFNCISECMNKRQIFILTILLMYQIVSQFTRGVAKSPRAKISIVYWWHIKISDVKWKLNRSTSINQFWSILLLFYRVILWLEIAY